MNTIEITNIRLMSLHVEDNVTTIQYAHKKVKTTIRVQYNLKEKKSIRYRFGVVDEQGDCLYHAICEYGFSTNEEDFLEEDVIKEVMDILQPRIEVILTLIYLETGYSTPNFEIG